MTLKATVVDEQRVAFYVPGVPRPQGSKRAFMPKGGKRPVIIEDNVKTRPWRSAVTHEAREAMAGAGPATGAVSVLLRFDFTRPVSHYTSKGALRAGAPAYPGRVGDVDKLARNVLDAMTEAGSWRDDSQVVELRALKAYADRPGLSVVLVPC